MFRAGCAPACKYAGRVLRKVISIRTARVRLPMQSSLRWGSRSELSDFEHVLVRVDADDGSFGIAEAPVRPTIYGETVASIQAVLASVLAPHLIGRDLNDDAALQRALSAVPYNYAARGALDVAVREARVRAAGGSLVETYRGPREGVRVSYILGIDEPQAMVAEAERVAGLGVTVFKVKVGRDHAADERVIRELGAVLGGTNAVLYADANEAYVPGDAARRLERLAVLGVAWVEEPLPVHLLRERAELKRLAILPIIADDSAFTLRDLERELAFDTFDILNVKPARTGYGESVEMLGRAAAAGKGAMIGSQAASGLGTVHAAVLASRSEVTHPSELSFPLRLERDTLAEPLVFENGMLFVDQLTRCRLRPELQNAFHASARHV